MSLPGSETFASTQNAATEIQRHSANYVPSIWGDRFLAYSPNPMEIDEKIEQQYQKLKEEVKMMLDVAVDKPSKERLKLIDAIQRLGVSYHFEIEIDQMLQQIHKNYHNHADNDDLYTAALCFRLLRQQGYNISCAIFEKFMDKQGSFTESLVSDVHGMMSLYEAAHFRVHGEDILDEALIFTVTHLESMQTKLSPPLSGQVAHALKQSIRRALPRLQAKHYISTYQQYASHSEVLLNFAKLDFNILQKVHQKELGEISRWWKDLDFARKLPFARDRIVECYFWILGVYFEPQYYLGRKITAKVISMESIIDDTYDAYGTFEELQLFTDAVERWDINCVDQLPEYMKHSYRALLDVYEEMDQEMTREGRSDLVHYAKEAMKIVVRAYFVEAKWYNKNYTPTMEEYMPNALVSCGYFLLSAISFLGMGDIATKEVFEWLFKDPKILRAASMINRLMNDIVSSEFEQKRGHVASGVHCYMQQHGVTEEEVHKLFREQIVDAWKDMNEALLRPFEVEMPLQIRMLNFARMMDLLYVEEDAYTHLGKALIDGITTLLIDPVPYTSSI